MPGDHINFLKAIDGAEIKKFIDESKNKKGENHGKK